MTALPSTTTTAPDPATDGSLGAMADPETVTTITIRELVLDAKRPYRIAAAILAPGALVGVALAVASDDKSMAWRLVIGALSLLAGATFVLVAFRPGAKIPLGTTTTVRPRD